MDEGSSYTCISTMIFLVLGFFWGVPSDVRGIVKLNSIVKFGLIGMGFWGIFVYFS